MIRISTLVPALLASLVAFGCGDADADVNTLAPESQPLTDVIITPAGEPGQHLRLEERVDGAMTLYLTEGDKRRALDTVGGEVGKGQISVRFFQKGLAAWTWYEARTQSQSTGGSRYAVQVGDDISLPSDVRMGDYGGQLYRVVGADRIDDIRVVMLAFQESLVQDEEHPNLRVLQWHKYHGVTNEIDLTGVMADHAIGIAYDAESNSATVAHRYHGDFRDTVVALDPNL